MSGPNLSEQGATPRHVVVFNQAAVPVGSAGGTRHVELFERLDHWTAEILAGNKSYLDQQPVPSTGFLRTVPVIRSYANGPSRVLNWISYMFSSMARGLRGKRPDAVWGSSPQMGAAVVGLALARMRRVPFILEVRDLWPHILVEAGVIIEEGWTHRVIRRLEEFLYRSATAIVVLAEGTQRELADRGFDDGKVVVIPNGADVASFDVDIDRDAIRADLGLTDSLAVVYAGAHGPANGLSNVIDAAAELSADDSRAMFVLIGNGTEKPKLVERVRAERLGNVKFLEPVPKNQIPVYYRACDVGLHCLDDVALFKYGVSPNKLYDYMAAGLPVVTNAGGDVAAMVEEAGSGVAVGPREIATGVRQVERADAAQFEAWRDGGRRFIMTKRSRAELAVEVERLLDRLTASPR